MCSVVNLLAAKPYNMPVTWARLNLRQTNWPIMFAASALLGIVIGYFITLVYHPDLIPPVFRFGGLNRPTTVLLLGVDIVYFRSRGHAKADQAAFNGRSDTMLLARFDPIRNQFSVLSIPRDTSCEIPGNGRQKINSANALGGPQLACRTVHNLTGIPIDHYLVLNVHGLVDLVDAVGGITVQVPKRMRYRDNAAKLNINLAPGPHRLNGTEAMGFVRFRHDALGDIGRVQRQELFMRAVMDQAASPACWTKAPQIIKMAGNYIKTDMSVAEMMQVLSFMRGVPEDKQQLVMLPGNFSGTGDWAVDEEALSRVVSAMLGQQAAPLTRDQVRLSIENASSSPQLARKLSRYLSGFGYPIVSVSGKSDFVSGPVSTSRIIAERGNSADARQLQKDLKSRGKIVNASIGDIQSSITLVAGDDLIPLVEASSGRTTKKKLSR